MERPSNGKRIPKEYCQEVIIKKEGNGNDSFISMCGMRIADFFKHIWAKVTEALGLKKKTGRRAAQATEAGVSEARHEDVMLSGGLPHKTVRG